MYEITIIGLVSLLTWAVNKRAYQKGFQVGMHVGFTNGLWKCKERDSARKSINAIKRKQSELSWVD
jgi:hypothetical protein